MSLTLDEIVSRIESGNLREVTHSRVELKSDWNQDAGKDISAIANDINHGGGWVIVGMDDRGRLTGKNEEWLKRTEEQISNHINQYLSPGRELIWSDIILWRVHFD